ncbi:MULTISPECIES: hypothetical protein [Pontibacillus]|uniref:Lipoprotein n=1 Tax=Pontibacillus chungwhensis TaxID=265426 RepID=A0ABY8V2S7_9BACI|nr:MULTISPECIES: hypothetical protein [Pontibacillus]MCD5324403.1 hypothetical protein [Pontibacillus sp. HN14]WIF99301.1 hypothetical protein QNI29_06475 [Pontibacillus chungwhensis]
MKKGILLLFFVSFVTTACSGNLGELTRVDVQQVMSDGSPAEAERITDKESIQSIRDVMKEVDWEDKSVDMLREPEARAVFYYQQGEDSQEHLVEYDIWFTDGPGFAVLMSEEEGRKYGVVQSEQTAILREMFVE